MTYIRETDTHYTKRFKKFWLFSFPLALTFRGAQIYVVTVCRAGMEWPDMRMNTDVLFSEIDVNTSEMKVLKSLPQDFWKQDILSQFENDTITISNY